MRNPIVSVVIATYDRAQLVEQAIGSVLQQTYRDLEVIVVDNGSTDGTAERLPWHDWGRVRLVRLERNQGRSVPRNVGIKEARGKYVAFLDSDDLWCPRKLEEQVSLLDRNDDVGLVHAFSEVISYSGHLLLKETHERLALHRVALARGYTYQQMSLRCLMFTSAVVARRELLNAVNGYDTSMPILEDWDLYLRLSLIAEIGTVEEALVRYRQHGNHTSTIEHVQGRVNVCHKHIKLLDRNSVYPFRRIARRNFLLNLASAHYVWGKTKECRHWMKAAIRIDPRVLIWPEFLMCSLSVFVPGKLLERLRSIKRAVVRQMVQT